VPIMGKYKEFFKPCLIETDYVSYKQECLEKMYKLCKKMMYNSRKCWELKEYLKSQYP
jgi:hypothetical protein